MSKTGGGPGSNQYGVRGTGKMRGPSPSSEGLYKFLEERDGAPPPAVRRRTAVQAFMRHCNMNDFSTTASGAVLIEGNGPAQQAIMLRQAPKEASNPDKGSRYVGVCRSTYALMQREPARYMSAVILAKVLDKLGANEGIQNPVSRAATVLKFLHDAGLIKYDGHNDGQYHSYTMEDASEAALRRNTCVGPAAMAVLAHRSDGLSTEELSAALTERGFIANTYTPEESEAVTRQAMYSLKRCGLASRQDGRWVVEDTGSAPSIHPFDSI